MYIFVCVSFVLWLTEGSRVSLSPPNRISVQSANIVSGQYAYMRVLLQLDRFTDASNPHCGQFQPHHYAWLIGQSLLLHTQIRSMLPMSRQGLLSGFRIGFDCHSVPLQPYTRNHPSDCENEGQVRGYIAAERETGHLVGPLCQSDLTGIHTSLIGLVPKSEPNQWRMIVD